MKITKPFMLRYRSINRQGTFALRYLWANGVFIQTAMTLGVTTEHESLISSFPHAPRLKPAGTSLAGIQISFNFLDPR